MDIFTFDTKHKLKVSCFKNDIVFCSELKKGNIYEDKIVYNHILPLLKMKIDPVILDIGAHIGSHSLIYSTQLKNPTIHCFEPQIPIFNILEKNIKDNNLKCCNLHNNAVGHINMNTTMSKTLYDGYNCDIEYNTSKIMNYGGVGLGENGQNIQMITIDSLQLTKCDFIKIDVEGAESLVIRGSLETIQKFHPIIFFESTDKCVSEEMKKAMNIDFIVNDAKTLLTELGYKLIMIDNCNILAIYKNSIVCSLIDKEKTLYSESGEDGILFELFKIYGVTNKFYVEFGAEDGSQCNTKALRIMNKFQGILFDSSYENIDINLYKHFINEENVLQLFQEYKVPDNFDLLSVDIDSHDFYVLNKILTKYTPRIFVCEYNATHFPDQDKVIKKNETNFVGNYFGASILAFYNLGKHHDYSLVYANNKGVNLFFVHNDVINNSIYTIPDINDVDKIYKTPKYGNGPNGGHFQDPLQRDYVTSEELL